MTDTLAGKVVAVIFDDKDEEIIAAYDVEIITPDHPKTGWRYRMPIQLDAEELVRGDATNIPKVGDIYTVKIINV